MVNKFEQEETNLEDFDFNKFDNDNEINLDDIDLISPNSNKKESELLEVEKFEYNYPTNSVDMFYNESKYVRDVLNNPNNRQDFYMSSVESIIGDFEKVLDFVEYHNKNHNERHKILQSYYEGKNFSINKYLSRRKQNNKSDFRLVSPFARNIVDSLVAYSYSNDIVVSDVNEKNQEFVSKLFNKSRLNSHNKRLSTDTMCFGHAYEINYRNKKGKDMLKVLSVYNTFIIYSDDIEKEPLCGIYYVFNSNGTISVTMYLYDSVITVNNIDLSNKQPLDRVLDSDLVVDYNGFRDVQIVEYLNNDEKISAFEPVVSLIDAHDSILSDIVNVSSDTPDALLKIQGVLSEESLSEINSRRLKDSNMLYLQSGTTPDGSNYSDINAEYMTSNYDISGNKTVLDTLNDLIYTQSNTPNFSDKSFGSATSGIAMQNRLYSTDIIAQISQSMFKEGLGKRYELWSNLYTDINDVNFSGLDLSQLEYLFVENVPINVFERVDTIVRSGGKISNETLINYLPDTTWEIEQKRLKEEKDFFKSLE